MKGGVGMITNEHKTIMKGVFVLSHGFPLRNSKTVLCEEMMPSLLNVYASIVSCFDTLWPKFWGFYGWLSLRLSCFFKS